MLRPSDIKWFKMPNSLKGLSELKAPKTLLVLLAAAGVRL